MPGINLPSSMMHYDSLFPLGRNMKIRPRFLFYLSLTLVCCSCASGERHPLCILHTNDLHGHIAPERVSGWKSRLGGAAVLAGCVREIRAGNRAAGIPTLLLDAGDIFMGTPEGNISGGRAVTEVMNAAGYDAMTIGNHEFDYGVPTLEELARSAAFPFLGANVYITPGRSPPEFLKPSLLFECGPLTVGVIGVITPTTPSIVMPGRIETIGFSDPAAAVRAQIAELDAKGANLIVVLSHCGIEELTKLARDVPGIGVIISGHDHALLKRPIRVGPAGTIIVQAGDSGRYLGRLDLMVDLSGRRPASYHDELIALTEGRCPPEPSVAAIVQRWRNQVGRKFEEVVGSSLADITAGDDAESQIGDMITDSMRAATGAEIAFHNSYGIRSPLPKGTITYRDIYTIMPFDNMLYSMTLTGAEIRSILEQSLALRDGLLQVSGLTVRYDPAATPGRRVISVMAGAAALDAHRRYTVVTNSYLAAGGDNYVLFREARDVTSTGILDRDTLSAYIRARSPLSPEKFRPSRMIPR
jgi:2',3'-cyclic-nucleotide 2'-phosphodiesterase (5'-nucleotidase family)